MSWSSHHRHILTASGSTERPVGGVDSSTTPVSSSESFRAASGVAAKSSTAFPAVPDDSRDMDRHIDPEFREDECDNCGGLADDAQPCRYCGLGMWGGR